MPDLPTTVTRGLGSHQLSRRALLRTSGLFGATLGLGSLLAACGVAADDGDGEGDEPQQGGTLTLAVDGTSAVIDPAFYTTLGDWMAVDAICRGLTFMSFQDTEVQPDLAESWEISDDGLVYTFTLRQGVTFHDGTTFTSADVLASFARQFDPEDPTLPEGASRPLAIKNNVAGIEAPDDQTVVLTLTAKDSNTLAKLSDIGGRIISAAALTEFGADIGGNLVGTGPFKLVSATSGQSVTMEAFEDFRLGRPPIDRLVMQQVQDSSTIISSLLSGDISATQFTPYSAFEQLSDDDSVTVYDTPYGFTAIMMMDVRRPALAELEVRQAINMAVDREAIVSQAFFGVGDTPDGFAVPPAITGYDPDLADLSTFDPDAARALLESVGAVGRTVRLMAASDSWHPRAMQLVEQNLTDIGLVVETESVDPATYFGRIFDPEDVSHELMIWERNIYVPDPDNMVGAMAIPTGVYGNFATGMGTLPGADRFPALVAAARDLPIGDERTAAYSDIQRQWAEEFMTISMLAVSTNLVVSGADVQGMNVEALGNHRCFMENASV